MHRIGRFLGRALLLLFLLAVGLAGYLGTFGCPEWLAAEVVERLEMEDFAIETGVVKLHLLRGIILKDAKFYRKQVVGPAALEAGQILVSVDPLAPLKGKGSPPVRRITVNHAVIRPSMLAGPLPAETNVAPRSLPATRFRVELSDVEIYGMVLERLSCEVILKNQTAQIDELNTTVAHGGRRGEIRRGTFVCSMDRNLVEGRMETLLDPHILIPLLRECEMPDTVELVRQFEFGREPPRCEVKFSNVCKATEPLLVETKFWFQDGKYEGVDLLRADGTVTVDISSTNYTVAVKPLFIVRREGTGSGGFMIDLERSTVEFEGSSTVNPQALVRMIGILTNGVLDEFRFDGQASVSGKGFVNYTNLSENNITLTVAGRDLGWGPLKMDEYSLGVRVTGLTNALENIHGRLYNGDLSGRAAFILPPDLRNDATFQASGTVSHASFERLMKDLDKETVQQYEGLFSCKVDVEGLLGEKNTGTIKGHGDLRVKEGKVLLLPVFGGLTKILTDYIPGLDFVVNQTDVKSKFTIADKKIHSEDVNIEGSVVRLFGYGDYYFNNHLDFRVQVKLLRERNLLGYIIGIPTWILSKFFEFRLERTITDPRWTAFSSTVDLLEKIGLKGKKEKHASETKPAPPENPPPPPKPPEKADPEKPKEQ